MPQKKGNNGKGIRDRISHTFEDTKERIGDAKEKADEYVRDHPMQSIAVAAGVGAAVAVGVTALLLRPRRKSFLDRLFDLF